MPEQYGFYFDPSRCVQCRACETACKDSNKVEPGVQWIKIDETWQGDFPDVSRTFSVSVCRHCEKPACVPACPTEAITKRKEDGIVVVDREKCNGCRECLPACPFGVPQFGTDGIMQKCDYCIGNGTEPVCAIHCPTGALIFGDINMLPQTANGKRPERYPGPTYPSLIILKQV